ncbi:MAG: tetratricopeptide repeat protein [Treponema sp.]|nr:tetratricopeptide repeat protein [Treponema sp.]
MRLDPILSRAVRLAKKANYDGAIKILEAEAHNRYYGNFTFYYILGLSYLKSRIYGVALRYLNLALERKLRDTNTILALAAVYLNHGDTDKAVDLYLEVQTIDPRNSLAKKALGVIRKHPGPDNISAWIESDKLHTLFPSFPPVGISSKTLCVSVLSGLAVLALALGLSIRTGLISLPETPSQRVIPAELSLGREELEMPLQTGGSYRYVLTRSQVVDEYNEALGLFGDLRDEAARVGLNRLLESNASEPVKNRARLILSYMEVPRFDTLQDRFTYAEVIGDPFLFRDVHVIWRGMASNLLVEHNRTSFDFLVGFDTYRIVEGIVQVDYDFAIPVNPDRPLEILGRVIPLSGEIPGIRIQGVALNQAGMLDQIRQP